MNIKKEKIIVGFILSLIAGYMIYTHLYNSNELDKNGVYGVGKLIDYGYCSGGSNCGKYEYYHNGKKYNSTHTGELSYFNKSKDGNKYANKFYIIRYSSTNPEIAELFLNKEVKDIEKIRNAGFNISNLK